MNTDGSPAFCLVVVNRWQFNVFKTGPQDRVDRVTVEDVVNKSVLMALLFLKYLCDISLYSIAFDIPSFNCY